MTRRRSLAALAAAAAWPLALHAQPVRYAADDLAHAAALRDAALADNEAWRLVRSLTQDVGPRPAGSPGDAKAVAWALRELQALRLQAVRAEPMPIRVWQRGPAQARLIAPQLAADEQTLVMAALGNSVPAPDGGIEAELAYYPSLEALRADSSDRARGRIVFVDQPTDRSRDGAGYGRTVAVRFGAAGEAGKRGALALAIRSVGTSRERVAHTGAMAYDLSVPRIPAFAVSNADADRIAQLHGSGQPMRMQFTLQARLGVDATTHNVIAEVPGAELASEIVLIGAHLDSWDLGPGALDNAAGVAIVSAAAALIRRAGQTPRRTVRVVLFGNEENGFDGARTYGDRYRDVVHQLVAESDFGAGRIYRVRSRVAEAALPLMDGIAETLAPLGVAHERDNRGTPGPDAALLMRRLHWPAIGLSQDGSHYFDVHHTERDTVEAIDPAALRQNVAAWAAMAWLAAQAPLPFGPLSGSAL